jgi:hypothetical protein
MVGRSRGRSSKAGSLNADQVRKAVQALANYTGQQKDGTTGLLDDDDELVYLIISLRQTPTANRKDKPIPL